MFFSECLKNKHCSAVDNKNTCKENVCQCNGGYIPEKDACKPCKKNEISVQNPESLNFSCGVEQVFPKPVINIIMNDK